jgi:hypothetical protein
MDDELRGILEAETNEIVSSNFSLFDDWWESTIEIVSEEVTCSSTDLWTKFKQDNKSILSNINITGDKFKQYLKSKVPLSAILLRNKNTNSAFDIKGIKLKYELEEKVIEEKLELDLNEEIVNKKKVVKKK